MSTARTPRPATERDFEALPDGVIAHLIDGEIVTLPRPGWPHITTASDLGGLLVTRFRFGSGGPGGWVILHEPDIRFETSICVPDLAGWRRERYRVARKGPYTVVPDWVCEILSPSTVQFDRTRKLPLYARCGVSHAWVVDPIACTLEVLRLHEGRWLIVASFKGDDVVRAEPFDAVELALADIWAPADETTGEADGA